MVSGYKQQIFLSKGTPQRRKRRVEFAQRPDKPGYVVPMAVKLVEIYKVGEQKPRIGLTRYPRLDQLDSLGISRRMP